MIIHSEYNGLLGIWINGTEHGLTNVGSWYYGPCDYLVCGGQYWTNQGADFAFASVDSGGMVSVTQADVLGMAEFGFTIAFASVGLLVAIRWLAKTFSRAARIPVSYD